MKILIIGANGLLGKKAKNMLSKEHEIIGTCSSQPEEGLTQLNITDYDAVHNLITQTQPDLVFNAAAFNDVDLSDTNKKAAWAVNATGVFNIAHVCSENNTPLITFSTDYVFSGNNSPYTEESIPHPLGFYGHSKLAGEQATLMIHKNAIVIRAVILYGFNDPKDKPTVVSDVIEKLTHKQDLIVTDARIKYPLLIDDVVTNAMKLFKQGKNGLFHFASKNPLTRYQWAQKTAETFKLDTTHLIEGEPAPITNRPYDVQLINTKEPELHFNEVEEGLSIIKKQIEEYNGKTH